MKKKSKSSSTTLSHSTTKPQEDSTFLWRYFVLAFIEGATVMAVELFGAKMMTPYYGSSLIVWTTVIGITLL